MIKKLFFTLFLVLLQTVVFAQTNTYTGLNNGGWNTPSNWSLGSVPTASHDVIIPSGKTVNIDANAVAKSISISGSLTISDSKLFTVGSNSVWGDFTVNSGGSFTMGSGNDLSTLVVCGNYINYGTTDFWKSTVIITGDLISPATSQLQKQGNVIVGGNVIGDFNLTGGTGEGQIYAVNPNATVTITPIAIDNNVTPGTQLSGSESTTLIDLVNQVIYGSSSCTSYTLTDPASNISTCTGGNGSVTISTTGSLPSYQWQINSGSGWGDLSGQTTATLILTEVTVGMSGNKYRVRVTAGSPSCTKNGNYVTLSIDPTTVGGTVTGGTTICSGSTSGTLSLSGQTGSVVKWQSSVSPFSSWTDISNTANAYTSGALTVTTQFRAVVQSGSCTMEYSVPTTVTVNSLVNNTADGFSSSSFCIGNQATITFDANNGSGVLPYSLSYINDATPSITYSEIITTNSPTAFNLSPNPTTTTHYTLLSITDANGCVNSSPLDHTATATILSLPSTPTVGTITQPTCSLSTGSVVLSGLPASGTWTINPGGYTGAGTTTTISGLAADTYNFTVSNGSCSSGTVNVVINPVITNTWTTSWSNGTPTSLQVIVFNENFSSTADLEACSCQVTNGANVVINGGHALKVTNAVAVVSGSLTFENNASLVQVNDFAVNSGNIIYKRTTTPIFNTDYVYWSSPVVGFTLGGITTGTLYYSFNGAANSWVRRYANTVMTAGTGYIVRGAGTGLATSFLPAKTVTFTGEPNNGVITASIGGANTSNLIGNPYPSAIDANAFLTANTGVLEGTLYFWTHNIPIQLVTNITNGTAGSGTYAYTSDDYAIYNLTGGTVTVSGTPLPTGKIAAGQGFIAMGFSAGNAVFNNSMRLSSGGAVLDNTQFFKQTRASKTVAKVEKSRIWLNLTNAQGAFKQTLVGYVTNATNEYDNSFDGESFDGNKFIDFYSVVKDKNLTIQGRALPFDENDEVQLGYSSSIKGVFSIAIDQIDGLLVSQDVFIEDKNTNIVQNLKQGAYSFSTEVGTFKNRFVLRYTNANTDKTLGTDTFETLETSVFISKDKNELKITSELENIKIITVFDLLGKKVFDKEAINNKEFLISNIDLSKQAVIVKVTLANGQLISKKVIY